MGYPSSSFPQCRQWRRTSLLDLGSQLGRENIQYAERTRQNVNLHASVGLATGLDESKSLPLAKRERASRQAKNEGKSMLKIMGPHLKEC